MNAPLDLDWSATAMLQQLINTQVNKKFRNMTYSQSYCFVRETRAQAQKSGRLRTGLIVLNYSDLAEIQKPCKAALHCFAERSVVVVLTDLTKCILVAKVTG
jgi:hypothetical protein